MPPFSAGTPITAMGQLATLAMGTALLVLPRRYALAPIIILVCYMTMGEGFLIAGLNFTMIRILLLFGWLRIIIRGEWRRLRLTAVDKVIIAWTIVRTVNYALVWGSTSAFINRAGYAYNILGAYFLFRFLLRDIEDVRRGFGYLAAFIIPLTILIGLEKLSGRNPFAVLGGVPAISEVRDGVVRCQGPFFHSILAGTFGGTTAPLFAGLWWQQKSFAVVPAVAILCSTIIVAAGGSSGPVLAYAAGMLALSLWPLRRNMRLIRWGMVALLVVLQAAMNAPVWFVIARLSVFSGSTGWFRGFLIDMTVRHFGEWWLIGSNAAPLWSPYLADVTNQYIAEGLDGGILAMALFVAILAFSFRSVGRAVRAAGSDRRNRLLAWSLGAALTGHAVSFVSVTYFDQMFVLFYLLLAGTVVVSEELAKSTASERRDRHSGARSSSALWPRPGVLQADWGA